MSLLPDLVLPIALLIASRARIARSRLRGAFARCSIFSCACTTTHHALKHKNLMHHNSRSLIFFQQIGIFRLQFVQICLLAFPAMVIGSLITAVILWGVMLSFNGEWPFLPCWLAGVITSATDPVAVVALLKELGASKTLGTLIEGESLLNDGSAVVLFVVVKNAIGYSSGSIPPTWVQDGYFAFDVLRIVAQMLFLGIVIGLVIGLVTRVVLRYVYNNRMVEGPLLIGVAYLTFWAAEIVMGSSAVLAVVIYGLYMNKYRSCISPECLHFLHEFFELICHMLNTIIFVVAGLQLGMNFARIVEMGSQTTHVLAAVLSIYFIVLISRGLAIGLFYPLLKRFGTGVSWQEAVVMWWGGLRGAVGLALALAVAHTEYDMTMWSDGPTGSSHQVYNGNAERGDLVKPLFCRDNPDMILMVSAMVVILTVVVNGITIAPLMRKLDLIAPSEDRVFMLKQAWDALDKKTEKFKTNVQTSNIKHFRHVKWETVKANQIHRDPSLDKTTIDDENAYRCAWLQVIHMEAMAYHSQFESGVISSEAYGILDTYVLLLRAKARSSSYTGQELSDLYDEAHANLFKEAGNPAKSGVRKAVDRLLGITPESVNVILYEVALSYLWAERRVKSAVDSKGDTFKKIHDEHEDNKERTIEVMQRIERSYPSEIDRFKTHHVTTRVLREQRAAVEHLMHDGDLLDLDANQIVGQINDKLQKLYRGEQPVVDFVHKLAKMGKSTVALTIDGAKNGTSGRKKKKSSVYPTREKSQNHDMREAGVGAINAMRLNKASAPAASLACEEEDAAAKKISATSL